MCLFFLPSVQKAFCPISDYKEASNWKINMRKQKRKNTKMHLCDAHLNQLCNTFFYRIIVAYYIKCSIFSYLSDFISRLAGSSKSWLCWTSSISSWVRSIHSGSRGSRLYPTSNFRRPLAQKSLCDNTKRHAIKTFNYYQKMKKKKKAAE